MLLIVEWQYVRLQAIKCETSVELKQAINLRWEWRIKKDMKDELLKN